MWAQLDHSSAKKKLVFLQPFSGIEKAYINIYLYILAQNKFSFTLYCTGDGSPTTLWSGAALYKHPYNLNSKQPKHIYGHVIKKITPKRVRRKMLDNISKTETESPQRIKLLSPSFQSATTKRTKHIQQTLTAKGILVGTGTPATFKSNGLTMRKADLLTGVTPSPFKHQLKA